MNMKKESKVYFGKNYGMIMVKTEFKKVGSKWVETDKEEKEITEECYNNIVNAKNFMKNLGGYERHEKNYTYIGYIVTRINSISPNKKDKSLYEFTVIKK